VTSSRRISISRLAYTLL